MRFSSKEQYGLRAMVEFARRYGQGLTSLSAVAQAQALSPAYLEHVLRPLRRAGLLDSARGAHGGYQLARPPQAITVGEVIRALEGSVVPFACVSDSTATPCLRGEGACAARRVWQKVRDRLAEALDTTTLCDLY